MVCYPFYYLTNMEEDRTRTESVESKRKETDMKASYGPLSLEDGEKGNQS